MIYRVRWVIPAIRLFRPNHYSQVVDEVYRPKMLRAVRAWGREAKLLTPVDTGDSKGSIYSDVQGGFSGVRGGIQGIVGGTQKTLVYLEDGTRPHFPPVSALRGWAKRVLGDENLAFVVARAISRRGTKAHHMFRKGFDKVRPSIIADFHAGLKEVVNRLLGG